MVKQLLSSFALGAAGILMTLPVYAQNTTADVVVEAKSPTIIQYLFDQAPEFSTLVKVINASGLSDNISGKGPFTLIAPRNKAFEALPPGTLEKLLYPENIGMLQKLLTFHIIAGNLTQDDIKQNIKEGGGAYSVLTIGQGGNLVFTTDQNGNVLVKDYSGIQTPLGNPIIRNNGVVYTIDRVLKPQQDQ